MSSPAEPHMAINLKQSLSVETKLHQVVKQIVKQRVVSDKEMAIRVFIDVE